MIALQHASYYQVTKDLSLQHCRQFVFNSLGLILLLKGVMTWAKVTLLVRRFYHEQMGPIPTSNESLEIALSNAHT